GLDIARSTTVETTGDLLGFGRVGQQIACQLFEGELVERHISVEGPNHPVAIGPQLAQVVSLKTVRVGIARGIEPGARPLLSILRRRQEFVHEVLNRSLRIAPGSLFELSDLLRSRR